MKVEVISHKRYNNLFVAVVDGKETDHLFDNEAKAFIYAGLYESMSANDASHLIMYISAMIDGMKEQK